MSDVEITNELVQFTKNDVSAVAGQGRYLTEQSLADVLEILGSFVLSGLTLPTSVSLTSTMAAGVAFVKGYRVTTTATNLTFGASATSYVWLELVKDGSDLVTKAVFEILTTTTPTRPDFVPLCVVTTSGSAITAVQDISFRSGGSSSGSDLNAFSSVGL